MTDRPASAETPRRTTYAHGHGSRAVGVMATRTAMERYATALRDWGARPDAVDAFLLFQSLAWLT